VIAGPQPRPTVLYNSLQHMFPPKHTQALLFQRVTPVCTRPGFKLRIFSDLRTVVLQFPVFVVRLFELCRAFSVRCALCTEKGWGEGGVIFLQTSQFQNGNPKTQVPTPNVGHTPPWWNAERGRSYRGAPVCYSAPRLREGRGEIWASSTGDELEAGNGREAR